MMASGPIRLLLIAFVLLTAVGPAWADVTVCIDSVQLQKRDAEADDKLMLDRHNEFLTGVLKMERARLHGTLTTYSNQKSLPLRFEQTPGCIQLTLRIRTPGASLDTQLLYRGRTGRQLVQLFRPIAFSSNWTFDGGSNPKRAHKLLDDALAAVGQELENINRLLLVRLVNEESENSRLSPVKLERGVVCDEGESCAVLPRLTLNDYLLKSMFKLEVELAGLPGEREVISKGLGFCSPYNNSGDLGIVVRYPPNDLPPRPWGNARFSLEDLILPPKDKTCRPGVKSVVSQPEARGAQ